MQSLSSYYGVADKLLAEVVIAEDALIDKTRKLRKDHAQRLDLCLGTPQAGILFLDIISNLVFIADHIISLAEVVTRDFLTV